LFFEPDLGHSIAEPYRELHRQVQDVRLEAAGTHRSGSSQRLGTRVRIEDGGPEQAGGESLHSEYSSSRREPEAERFKANQMKS
jgi:hypothetical protein